MKKRILVYAFVLIAALTLVGCKNGSSDDLLSLQFNGPGVMTTNGRYALTDHVYTDADYSVVAFYSSGSKNVTKEARITTPSPSNVKIGAGNTLEFTDPDWEGIHKFPLTIEYGGKKIITTVDAYGAGEAIGGLKNPKTKFLKGERIGTNLAGISFLDKSGNYISSSSSLPSSAKLLVFADGSDVPIKTLKEGHVINGNEFAFMYLTYLEFDKEGTLLDFSKPEAFEVEIIQPSDIVSGRITTLPSYPKAGDVYDGKDEFCKTYLRELKAILKDSDGNSYVVYATDENGNPMENFSIANISVNTAAGGSRTSGTPFESGDVVIITVEYENGVGAEGCADFIKKYTVSRR